MRSLKEKIVRFAGVGVVNSIIYVVATSLYVSKLGIGSNTASVLGYCTAMPLAFLAHRSFTFASNGHLSSEARRFLVTHLSSMLVSVFAMSAAVDLLGLHYGFGIFGAVVLVPIISFLALDNWVFALPKQARGDDW